MNKITRYASLVTVAGALSIPAAAQSPYYNPYNNGDTWKSAAIIGGSTIAGAIIGGKVAGGKGAAIGAAAGAGTGYVIDRHRRQNEYNNNYYGYNAPYNNGRYEPGYYPQNSGYYGNGNYYPQNTGYYGNGGYSSNGYYDKHGRWHNR